MRNRFQTFQKMENILWQKRDIYFSDEKLNFFMKQSKRKFPLSACKGVIVVAIVMNVLIVIENYLLLLYSSFRIIR